MRKISLILKTLVLFLALSYLACEPISDKFRDAADIPTGKGYYFVSDHHARSSDVAISPVGTTVMYALIDNPQNKKVLTFKLAGEGSDTAAVERSPDGKYAIVTIDNPAHNTDYDLTLEIYADGHLMPLYKLPRMKALYINADLASLSVVEASPTTNTLPLDKTFATSTTAYEAYAAGSPTVDVIVATADSYATVDIMGLGGTLTANQTRVIVRVTAESGRIKDYTLNLINIPKDGGGTYIITTAAQLRGLAHRVNAGLGQNDSYRLESNIDLRGIDWTPIGRMGSGTSTTPDFPFRGNFDGNGKIISNLTVDALTDSFQGLFGIISYGTVENLGLVNVNITVDSNAGGVAGFIFNKDTIIQNCFVTGKITGTGGEIGGIVGKNGDRNTSERSKVINCYSTVDIICAGNCGGIVGFNAGASIAGNAFGEVSYCYSTSSVKGTIANGGIVGGNERGIVKNCVALGLSASSGTNSGRVVGTYIGGSIDYLDDNYGRADMLSNGTTVTGNKANDKHGGDISTSQYNSQTWWATPIPDGPGFDFTTVWVWNPTTRLPVLQGFPMSAQNHRVP